MRLRPLPLLLLLPAVAAPVAGCASGPTVRVAGFPAGEVVNARAAQSLQLRVAVSGASPAKLTAAVDGRRVPVTVAGDRADVRPGPLGDGGHTLRLSVDGSSVTRRFVVDGTPPVLTVSAPATVPSLRTAVTLTGTARGATRLSADGRTVPLRGDAFTLTLPVPPEGLQLQAADAAGNVATRTVSVSVRHPLMRGVHLTGYGWNDKGLRNPVLELARQHKINTVELDVKEEDGYVNYDTTVALAHRVHAVRVLYDPKKVVAQLHRMGVRVVGRIVCFRDPKLASWAWRHGHRDWDVQGPHGGPYKSANYGTASFTNWANDNVRRYNIDLATEAAKDGFDDVMFDYVRRPDGPLPSMRFPGATVTAPVGVADFVKEASHPIRVQGAYLGLAVFGVSATRPKEVGQDIGVMARYVDYVAPMVYPSHWGPGEYGVADPNAEPYPIVHRSLKDFQKKTAGTDAQVMPWLQDFSLGVTYDTAHVVAQIRAAADDGIGSFLLWNAGCDYHAAAFTPDRSLPRTTD